MNYKSGFLVAVLLFINSILLADSNIKWQLGRDDHFVNSIRQSQLQNSQSIKENHQILLHTEINVYADKIIKRVKKARYHFDIESIQNYGTDYISYDELSESVVIHEAAVISASGEVIRFKPEKVKVHDPDSYQVFSNTKEILVPYSGIGEHAITMLEYEIILSKVDQETDWSQILLPQYLFHPLKSYELKVNWHDGIKPLWTSSSTFSSCSLEESILICKGSDIPGIVNDHQVTWMDELGHIIIGEIETWNTVIEKDIQAFNKALVDTTGLDKLVESISKKSDSLEQKIAAIHQFVAREIRYISFSEKGHAITPHIVSETLANRYGDCKDKSALLVELLKRISVDAYPVLVATKRTNPEMLTIPSMNYFDHMIVCFLHSGTKYCLDATDAYTDWQAKSTWIQNKVALELLPDKTPDKIKNDTYRWSLRSKTRIRFTDDGGMLEKQSRKFDLAYSGWLRSSLSGKSSSERRRWAVGQYQDQVSSKAEPNIEISGINDINMPLVIESETQYSSFQDVDQDLNYYELDAWINYEINSVLLKNKHYQSFFPGLSIQSEYEFDSSALWEINQHIAEHDLSHTFGSMQRYVYQHDKDKVIIKTKIKIPSRMISIAEMSAFNKFLNILKREAKIFVRGNKKT